MDIFGTILMIAVLLCSLVAGFLFAFAVIVMPGIKKLSDKEFIRAFQVMDGIIQRGQPLFGLVWAGSVLALLAAAVLGFTQFSGMAWYLLISATLLYLFGVQLTTITVNIPLNNRLQSVDVDTMDNSSIKAARKAFETKWNRWNSIRTFVSIITAALLIGILLIT